MTGATDYLTLFSFTQFGSAKRSMISKMTFETFEKLDFFLVPLCSVHDCRRLHFQRMWCIFKRLVRQNLLGIRWWMECFYIQKIFSSGFLWTIRAWCESTFVHFMTKTRNIISKLKIKLPVGKLQMFVLAWPRGLMDKASDFESEDCGFESHCVQLSY